jgi:hypothetical protein
LLEAHARALMAAAPGPAILAATPTDEVIIIHASAVHKRNMMLERLHPTLGG